MWTGFLHLHNVLRWLVLFAAFAAVIGAWMSFAKGAAFTKAARIRGLLFTIGMHLQLVVGIALIFRPGLLDTLTQGMVGEGYPRYVEHIFWMIIAVVVVQVGSILSKKGDDDRKRHKMAAIFYTIGLLAILAAIPWGRPLLPGM
jgi:hypothetical protein